MIRKDLIVASLLTFCLAATLFMVATTRSQEVGTANIFLKIDGIIGESTDSFHMDQIEIISFSWGENQTTLSGAGVSSSQAKMRNFRFQARVSRSSPLLFLWCANGRVLRYATLSVRTWIGSETLESFDYLIWYFRDVSITSYNTKMDPANSMPIDEFTISFGKIGVWYAQNPLSPYFKEGWDLKANKPWIPEPPQV